jgi:hypothetical protein
MAIKTLKSSMLTIDGWLEQASTKVASAHHEIGYANDIAVGNRAALRQISKDIIEMLHAMRQSVRESGIAAKDPSKLHPAIANISRDNPNLY